MEAFQVGKFPGKWYCYEILFCGYKFLNKYIFDLYNQYLFLFSRWFVGVVQPGAHTLHGVKLHSKEGM